MSSEISFDTFLKDSRKKKLDEGLAQKILGTRSHVRGQKKNERSSRGSSPALARRIGSGAISKPGPRHEAVFRTQRSLPSHSLTHATTHSLQPLQPVRTTGTTVRRGRENSTPIARKTRTQLLYEALDPRRKGPRDASSGPSPSPAQPHGSATRDFSIRGSAGGPSRIRAYNFIQGTTAKDIKQAFSETCGVDIGDVSVIQGSPTVTVELSFAYSEDAYRIIETFDGQKADGRVISVSAVVDEVKDMGENGNHEGSVAPHLISDTKSRPPPPSHHQARLQSSSVFLDPALHQSAKEHVERMDIDRPQQEYRQHVKSQHDRSYGSRYGQGDPRQIQGGHQHTNGLRYRPVPNPRFDR